MKTTWGVLTGAWVAHDTPDAVLDFLQNWSAKTELQAGRFNGWIEIARGKFYDWAQR